MFLKSRKHFSISFEGLQCGNGQEETEEDSDNFQATVKSLGLQIVQHALLTEANLNCLSTA